MPITRRFRSDSVASASGFVALGVGIALILFYGKPPASQGDLANRPLFAPPGIIKHFTFGYGEIMGDTLWLRVIQDFDYCEKSAKPSGPEVDLEKLPEDEKIQAQLPKVFAPEKAMHRAESLCNKGWVFHYVDAVTELAPKFRMAYIAGGTMMSVLVDDREGARLILEKGVERFPEDWTMSYRAAYHYLYEVNDPARAADLLIHAAKAGAPPWTYALAARLYTATGRAQLGKAVLEEAVRLDPKGPGAERIKRRLAEIDAVLEKGESGASASGTAKSQ